MKMKGQAVAVAQLARGFQESVIEVLVEKTMRAAQALDVKQVVLAGGVAANRGLRQKLSEQCTEAGYELHVPPLELCTDNAAMIAAAAYLKWERGSFDPLDIKAEPLLSLERWLS